MVAPKQLPPASPDRDGQRSPTPQALQVAWLMQQPVSCSSTHGSHAPPRGEDDPIDPLQENEVGELFRDVGKELGREEDFSCNADN